MKYLKSIPTKAIICYLLLCVFNLTSCKDTYYQYDIDRMQKTCESHDGINRFSNDVDEIILWCNDGTFHRLD